jgi:membrane protein
LVVLLLWVYYSAQIFLLGAEFTKVYAFRHGSQVDRGRRRFWDRMRGPAAVQPQVTPAAAREQRPGE